MLDCRPLHSLIVAKLIWPKYITGRAVQGHNISFPWQPVLKHTNSDSGGWPPQDLCHRCCGAGEAGIVEIELTERFFVPRFHGAFYGIFGRGRDGTVPSVVHILARAIFVRTGVVDPPDVGVVLRALSGPSAQLWKFRTNFTTTILAYWPKIMRKHSNNSGMQTYGAIQDQRWCVMCRPVMVMKVQGQVHVIWKRIWLALKFQTGKIIAV